MQLPLGTCDQPFWLATAFLSPSFCLYSQHQLACLPSPSDRLAALIHVARFWPCLLTPPPCNPQLFDFPRSEPICELLMTTSCLPSRIAYASRVLQRILPEANAAPANCPFLKGLPFAAAYVLTDTQGSSGDVCCHTLLHLSQGYEFVTDHKGLIHPVLTMHIFWQEK